MLQACVLGLARSITVSFLIESQITSQDRHSICNVNLFVDLVSMFLIDKSAIDPRLWGDWGTPKCSHWPVAIPCLLPISSRLWLVYISDYLCVYRNIYFIFCTNDIGKNKIPPRLPPVGPRLIRGWSAIVPFPGTFILINTHMMMVRLMLILSVCSHLTFVFSLYLLFVLNPCPSASLYLARFLQESMSDVQLGSKHYEGWCSTTIPCLGLHWRQLPVKWGSERLQASRLQTLVVHARASCSTFNSLTLSIDGALQQTTRW